MITEQTYIEVPIQLITEDIDGLYFYIMQKSLECQGHCYTEGRNPAIGEEPGAVQTIFTKSGGKSLDSSMGI